MPATVWVRPLGDTWQPIGGSRADRGVWHEGLEAVSDQVGPKTMTFMLKRRARALFADLLTRTPVVVEAGGVRVWAGRIKDTPEQSGAARTINVECVGGQAILDDDAYERRYVSTKLAEWKDERTTLSTNLASATQVWNVANQDGAITLGVQNGAVVGAGVYGGVMLDLGPGSTAKRVVVTVETSANSAAIEFKCRGTDAPEATAASFEDLFSATLNAYGAGPATSRGTFATAHRYVHLYLVTPGAGLTAAADHWVKIRSAQVFADTAYETGDASILTADKIILDALTTGTTGLSADRTGIGAPGFNFPDFAPSAPMTARQYVAAANAPHNWRFKIDEYFRPIFQARPTVPVIDLGNWPGSESDGGSSNSDEGIVTKVIVRGTGPDGAPISATRTQTGTIVDRQGGVSTVTLDASYMLTTAFANQLGDTHNATHRFSPFKGQAVVTAGGARRLSTGVPMDPAHLLLLTGELARRTDQVDPDTGALGRSVTMDQVTYRDPAQASTVTLDNTRNDFDALVARLGLLVPA